MNKYYLGIETSCDDTSCSIIVENETSREVLSVKSYDQDAILKKWGGVVPEIAARNHLEKLPIVVKEVLDEAKIVPSDLSAIGVTALPGLLGPLLTGLNCAKSLALINKLPIVRVNHLFAHLEAIHLTESIQYPYLGILVSGGHSIFFHVKSNSDFQVLGSTIDDACGEAFDKGGKLLGLGYPAGRIVDKVAKLGDPKSVPFPIGLKSSADCRLSYSGLKTSLRLYLEKNPEVLNSKPSQFETREEGSKIFYDVVASYQHAIVEALLLKSKYALEKVNNKNIKIVFGGGVACNSYLRERFNEKYKNVSFVAPKYCTDNGAMIANYCAININDAIPYPQCLKIDAKGRFIDKKEFNK